jgi:hypothetical protein
MAPSWDELAAVLHDRCGAPAEVPREVRDDHEEEEEDSVEIKAGDEATHDGSGTEEGGSAA